MSNCTEVVCGDDACGGSCGLCGSSGSCVDGQCVEGCVPQCNGIECGDDGCGGTCGSCGETMICNDGGQCILASGPAVPCPRGLRGPMVSASKRTVRPWPTKLHHLAWVRSGSLAWLGLFLSAVIALRVPLRR